MTHPIEPLVFTVPEYAALLHMSRASVHRAIRAGRIPVVRYGKVIRIPKWFADEELRGKAA
jgi:excisionase family DNA binding protein